MNKEELIEMNIKKFNEDIIAIKNVVFEFNSLIMEMPFVEKPNDKIIIALIKKVEVLNINFSKNIAEVDTISDFFKNNKDGNYINRLNVYLNAMSVLLFIIDKYIDYYFYKYNSDDDINTMLKYYKDIGEKIGSFTIKHQKYIKNLKEDYYV